MVKRSGAIAAELRPRELVPPHLAVAVYITVAIMWLIPDRRFERRLQAR